VAGSLELRRFRTRLTEPFVTASQRWSERTGIVLSLGDDAGYGRGEASPLPGYSDDDIDGCEAALAAITRSQLAALLSESEPHAALQLAARLVPRQVPAARFALEAALLDRLGRLRNEPVWLLLQAVLPANGLSAPSTAAPLPLAAIVPSQGATLALAAARQLAAQGVRAFKLKVGPGRPTAEQLDSLRALRLELGPALELRADANGSFERATLAESLRELHALGVAFVEEPLPDPKAPELASAACALAFDECLRRTHGAERDGLLALAKTAAVVLKPSVLGGFVPCLEWAAAAARHGCGWVVSHTLEGPLGWEACAQLAFALPRSLAAGLWPAAEQRPSELRGLELCGGALQASALGAPTL
jgi:L-Ala-D/L-Glu epimerase